MSDSIQKASPSLLPPWLTRACVILQVALGIAAGVAFYVTAFALNAVLNRHMTAWVLVYFVLVSFSAIVIHEAGHLLGARLAGMTPIGLQVGWIFFAATRRGWRVRWRKATRRLGGYAVAYPNPDLALRKQFMTMIAAGPLANLMTAAALLIALPFLSGPLMKAFFVALAGAHTLLGIANLVPTRRVIDSDGLALLKWRRETAEEEAGAVYARLMGRCVTGTTAEQLPEHEVARLEREPLPFPLVAFWLRLKAAQNRQEWSKAAEMAGALDRLVETMTPAQFKAMEALIDISRIEIAFSKAMRDHDAQALDVALPKSIKAWAPHLTPRVAALRAALAGDAVTRDRRLGEAARHAGSSVDLALEKSEAMMGGAILSIGVSWP